jgi:hypothetical protein
MFSQYLQNPRLIFYASANKNSNKRRFRNGVVERKKGG